MAKNAKIAFRLAGPWRKFAESLQTGAIVRSLRPIPGASLRHFSRPAPRLPQTGTKNPADLRHGSRQRCSFLCRVSRKMALCAFCCETWPVRWGKWRFPLPRFRENGPLCVLLRNVASTVGEMAVSGAAFPEKRLSVRSVAKRGRHGGTARDTARRHSTEARRTGRSGYSAMVKEMAAVLPAGSTTVRMWRPGEGARRSSWMKRVSPT